MGRDSARVETTFAWHFHIESDGTVRIVCRAGSEFTGRGQEWPLAPYEQLFATRFSSNGGATAWIFIAQPHGVLARLQDKHGQEHET
jgi:hypothetical protein